MTSILEVPEEKAPAAARGPSQALAMAGVGLGVVALGLATYLLVELRDARRQIAQLSEQGRSSDKRALSRRCTQSWSTDVFVRP